MSTEIIAASSPGPAIGRRAFGVVLSSTDDLSIKKAGFADQIFGSFVKGVPTFLGRLPTAVVLTLLDAHILFSWVCRSFLNSKTVTRTCKAHRPA